MAARNKAFSAVGTRASFKSPPSSFTMFGRNIRKLPIRPRASRRFNLVFGFSISAISLFRSRGFLSLETTSDLCKFMGAKLYVKFGPDRMQKPAREQGRDWQVE